VSAQGTLNEKTPDINLPHLDKLREISPALLNKEITFSMRNIRNMSQLAFTKLRKSMVNQGLATWKDSLNHQQGVEITPQGWELIRGLVDDK